MFITSLMLLAAYSAAAQDKSVPRKHDWKDMEKYLPSITRSLGGSFQQFDKLNGRVANLPQYESLKGYTATLGLGMKVSWWNTGKDLMPVYIRLLLHWGW